MFQLLNLFTFQLYNIRGSKSGRKFPINIAIYIILIITTNFFLHTDIDLADVRNCFLLFVSYFILFL